MQTLTPIRIAIVDDLLMSRKTIQLYLGNSPHIQTVVNTDSGFELLAYLQDHELDVVLLDLQMPKISGFDICTQLRQQHPEVKILIVSQLTDDESVHKIILTGAHGFFSKNTDPEGLPDAIVKMMTYGYFFSMDLQAVISIAHDLAHFKKTQPTTLDISQTEKLVLEQTAKGLSTKLIAAQLAANVRTIEKHKENILKKTGQKNIVGAIVMALKHNVIQLGDI